MVDSEENVTGVILLNTLQRYEVDMGEMNQMDLNGNIRVFFIELI